MAGKSLDERIQDAANGIYTKISGFIGKPEYLATACYTVGAIASGAGGYFAKARKKIVL